MTTEVDCRYFVYVVKCKDNSFYTGITTDVIRRINEHNKGTKGSKYTKGRRPVVLVYQEKCIDKSTALKREYQIKQLTRKQKLNLIYDTTRKI